MRKEVDFEILINKNIISTGYPKDRSMITFLTKNMDEFEISHLRGNSFEIIDNNSNLENNEVISIVKIPEANGTIRIITESGNVDYVWGDIEQLKIEKIVPDR